jgi:hypothetical protein
MLRTIPHKMSGGIAASSDSRVPAAGIPDSG